MGFAMFFPLMRPPKSKVRFVERGVVQHSYRDSSCFLRLSRVAAGTFRAHLHPIAAPGRRLLWWLIRQRDPLKHLCLSRIAVNRLTQRLHRQLVRDSQRQLADHLPGVRRHQGRPDDLASPFPGVERREPLLFTINKCRSTFESSKRCVSKATPSSTARTGVKPTVATSGSV